MRLPVMLPADMKNKKKMKAAGCESGLRLYLEADYKSRGSTATEEEAGYWFLGLDREA